MLGHVMPIPHQSSLYNSFKVVLFTFLCSMVQKRVNKTLLFIRTFSNHLPMFRCHSALPTGAISTTGATSTTWVYPSAEPFQNDFPMAHSIETNSPSPSASKSQVTHPSRCHDLKPSRGGGKISDFFGELRSDRNAFRAWKVTTSGGTLLPWLPMNR